MKTTLLASALLIVFSSFAQSEEKGGCQDWYNFSIHQIRLDSSINSMWFSNSWDHPTPSEIEAELTSWSWEWGDSIWVHSDDGYYFSTGIFKYDGVGGQYDFWNAPANTSAYFKVQDGLYSLNMYAYNGDIDCWFINVSAQVYLDVTHDLDTVIASMPAAPEDLVEKPYEQFKLGPNPANRVVAMEFPSKGNLTIADLNGKVILHEEVTIKKSITLDVSSYRKGIYIVNFVSENVVQTEKLVVN